MKPNLYNFLTPKQEKRQVESTIPATIEHFILFQAQGGIEECEWDWAELKALIVTASNPLRSSAYI